MTFCGEALKHPSVFWNNPCSHCYTVRVASASCVLLQYAENSICHIERIMYCSKVDKAVVIE